MSLLFLKIYLFIKKSFSIIMDSFDTYIREAGSPHFLVFVAEGFVTHVI